MVRASLALFVLGVAACDNVGVIGGPITNGTSGAAGTRATEVTGTGTGVAGVSGGGSGTAGTGTTSGAAGSASGTTGVAGRGAAGTTGAAGTGSSSGAAGTGSSTGAAGTGSTTGAAGKTGAAGTSGAAGAAVQVPHCKRGEAYQANSVADLQALSKGMSWWYNWTIAPEKAVAAEFEKMGLEFVPMIWGGDPNVADVVKQIPASAKYILGFNEPNFGAQSNITAQEAAARWPKIMEIARQRNLKIGSPSPQYCAGNCNDTDPFHWLDAFFAACTNCQVDFLTTHWYACTADALKSHLAKFKKYGKPLWVTEFSCMDAGDHTPAGEQAYMRTAVDILEKDPMVARYAWFTGRWTNPSGISLLNSASGSLTDLGNLYTSLPATAVCGQ
jgi:hypothetical protein